MEPRLLTPGERMTDRFDRAATMNFVTIARLHGSLTSQALSRALRCLEARHPLLRAQLLRGAAGTTLAPGAAEIALVEQRADRAEVLAAAAGLLAHREWPDAGPRAELHWLRHHDESSTLLLLLHHVVSDGSSGVLAMRDLLHFVGDGDPGAVQPLPSPGQDAFFPPEHAALRADFLRQLKAGLPKPRPVARVGTLTDVPMAERSVGVLRIELDERESTALQQRARSEGATVHGVLCAALAKAIAGQVPEPRWQRVSHPVDLRRYLEQLHGVTIGEPVGYYVSSVTTEHDVQTDSGLGPLAREISEAVRAGKAKGEPLLAAPVRGPLLVERTASMHIDDFRALCEQQIFDMTFSLTNLGRLEQLGCTQQVGSLSVEELYFVAAASVLGKFGGSAVSFRGRIALQLSHVMPFVPSATAEALLERTHALLLAYAG